MQPLNNIVTRINDWHAGAISGRNKSQTDDVLTSDLTSDRNNVHGSSSILDQFVDNFEELSKLDQSSLDTARDPGTVQVKTASGTKSLRKTDDGFVLTTENDSEERTAYKNAVGIWFNDQTTTYVLNEKTHTLTMAQERPNGTLFMVEQDLNEPVGRDSVDKSADSFAGRPKPAELQPADPFSPGLALSGPLPAAASSHNPI